mgnify:CR=1 FL=1
MPKTNTPPSATIKKTTKKDRPTHSHKLLIKSLSELFETDLNKITKQEIATTGPPAGEPAKLKREKTDKNAIKSPTTDRKEK